MNKKIISVLVSCILGLSVLAGCTGSENSTTTPQESKPAAQNALPVPASDGAGTAENALVNKEGFPLVNEPMTLKVFGQQGPVQAPWPEMDVLVDYQEKTGITLDFDIVPAEGYDEKKSLLFASNEYPDMFVRAQLKNEEIVRYGSAGVLLPLEDLLPEYAPNYYGHMQQYPAINTRITAPNGHIYALSDIVTENAAKTEKFWINTQWLAEADAEVPATVEEFEEVLRAFKGIAEADEYPMGNADLPGLIANLSGVWGLQRQFDQPMNVTDGVVSSYLTDNQFKDMLMWINKIYSEGLLDSEIFTQEYAKFAAKMAGQKMGFFFNQADDTFDSSSFQGIAPFAGKSEEQYVKSSAVARANGVFAITTNCQYPEAALRWVDYFYGEEGAVYLRFGVEGKTWNPDAEGKPSYVDGILNSPDGSGMAIGKFTIWPGGGAPQWLNPNNSIAVASPGTVAAQKALEPFIPETIYPMPLFEEGVNDRLLILQSDIETYVKETTAKFVKGDISFDEWDTYVATLEKIGIVEWVQIYQDSLTAVNGN